MLTYKQFDDNNGAFIMTIENGASVYFNSSMPSSNHIDLTLPANDTIITAPSDGYYYLEKVGVEMGQYVALFNNTISMSDLDRAVNVNNTIRCSIPANTGDEIRIQYTASGITKAFKFIYINKIMSLPDYSVTDEIDTGKKYIDGKTIYRKVVQEDTSHASAVTVQNAWTQINFTNMPTNIDTIVSGQIFADSKNRMNVAWYISGNGIKYYTPSQLGYTQMRLVLEYTKTTD